MRAFSFLLFAHLLGSAEVHAANWFELDTLAAASGLGVEVDTDSLRPNGAHRAVAVRVSYPEPRRHRWGASYRSVTATTEFECEAGLTGYRDAVFYSETRGLGLVAVREDGPLAPIPAGTRDLLPAASLELLIRAACSRPTPAVP